MPRATHTLLPRNRFAKRHYEAIATAIQEARRLTDYNGHDNIGVQFAIAELSRMFAKDNGRFNQDRFECACVPGANVRARCANLRTNAQNQNSPISMASGVQISGAK